MGSSSRRSFFRYFGTLGAGAAAASAAAGLPQRDAVAGNARAQRAYEIRESCAALQRLRPAAKNPTNGDEALYPNLIGSYTKGFLHSQLGEVADLTSWNALLHALSTQKHSG